MTQTAINQTAQEVMNIAVARLVIDRDYDDLDQITVDIARRLGRLLDFQRQHYANILFELAQQAENSDEADILTKAIQVIGE